MPRPSELPRVRERIRKAGVSGILFQDLIRELRISEACGRRHVARLRDEGWLHEYWEEKPSVGRPRLILVDRSLL